MNLELEIPEISPELLKEVTIAKNAYGIDFLKEAKQLFIRRIKFEEKRGRKLYQKVHKSGGKALMGEVPVMISKKKRLRDNGTSIKRGKIPPGTLCTECSRPLDSTGTESVPLFSPVINPKSPVVNTPICTGCDRLFSLVTTEEEKDELIRWVVKGELDPSIIRRDLSIPYRYYLLDGIAENYLAVADLSYDPCKGPLPVFFNQEDVRKLYRMNEGKDSILGHRLIFSENLQPDKKEHFASIDLNCISPFWALDNEDDYFSSSNIQLTCKLMKQVKRNSPQNELMEWLEVFRTAKQLQLEMSMKN